MFEPQATPYSTSFSSYEFENGDSYQRPVAIRNAIPDVSGYSGGPTLFEDRNFPPSLAALEFINQHEQRRRHNSLLKNNVKMSEHNMHAQELAAQDYDRDNRIEGPLVGEKKSSHAITEEYAKADPIYVAKTIALPQTYSHYRPIAGDGNCGWRAAGFSYFESLILRRNKSQLEDEIARLISYNNLISNAGGIELWLVEDMTDETINLLRELSVVVEESVEDAMSLLMDQFNHPVTSPNIIYHLRLLASVWLAANPDEYSGFIPDGLGVTGYRKNCLEVVNTEIEHLGMTLLIDALLKPIGITVEIVMLDRSEGSQANSHIFQSEDSRVMTTDAGGPMIHLLYRPSHYDILYKDVPATSPHDIKSEMSQYSNIQVNRAHSLPVQQHLNSAGDLGQFSSIDIDSSPFLDLPGFSMSHPHNYSPQYHSLDNSYTHSPMSSSMSPVLPSSTQVPSTTSNMTSPYQPQQPPAASRQAHNLQAHYGAPTQVPMHASQMSPTAQHPHNFNPSSLAHRPAVPSNLSSPIKQEISAPVATPNSFRPSHYQYQASANERHEPVICQTTTFKNSHFNTAHYLNPDFQPEEWTPENEERRGSS